MSDIMVPMIIGIFIGILAVAIFITFIQKAYYKKINDRSIDNVKILLKEFDKMKTEIDELKKQQR